MELNRPDYAYWETVDPVNIDFAAWLWCDLEPPPGCHHLRNGHLWPAKVLAARNTLSERAPRPPCRPVEVWTDQTATRSQWREIALRLGRRGDECL